MPLDAEECDAERATQLASMQRTKMENAVAADAAHPQPVLVDRAHMRRVGVHECHVIPRVRQERTDRPTNRSRADYRDRRLFEIVHRHCSLPASSEHIRSPHRIAGSSAACMIFVNRSTTEARRNTKDTERKED